MTSGLWMPAFALVGFAGFESLKIYKRLWAGLPPIPERRLEYFSVLAPLSLFVGGTAFAMDPDTSMKAIFVGFSIPASVKAIFDPIARDRSSKDVDSSASTTDEDRVEDIEVTIVAPQSAASRSEQIRNSIHYYLFA